MAAADAALAAGWECNGGSPGSYDLNDICDLEHTTPVPGGGTVCVAVCMEGGSFTDYLYVSLELTDAPACVAVVPYPWAQRRSLRLYQARDLSEADEARVARVLALVHSELGPFEAVHEFDTAYEASDDSFEAFEQYQPEDQPGF